MASKRKVVKATCATVSGAGFSKKRKQTFLKSYENDFLWIRAGKDSSSAFCKLCFVELNISHAGRNDIEKHAASVKHKTNKSSAGKTDIAAAMKKQGTSDDELNVIRAETLATQFLAEQNLPLAAADKFTKSVKLWFPDSKIAQRFQCGRSKTTCIVKELAKSQHASLIQKMKTGPFSLSTDGSNDEKSKQFPLVVRCCGSDEGRIASELYSVLVCEGSASGENIFRLIQNAMEEKQIPWGNCISFGTDNANVMIGHKKGVFAFLKEKNENIHLAGCTLHLVHIAAEKGTDCLPAAVDDILVDIHYYLKKSSKRVQSASMISANSRISMVWSITKY